VLVLADAVEDCSAGGEVVVAVLERAPD